MGDKPGHEAEIPLAIESVVTRLGELEIAFGAAVKPVIEAVRADLIEAMALRDRGDLRGALLRIGAAMDRLASVAGRLDAGEATLMRAAVQAFRAALGRASESEAKRGAAIMFERSGAVERKKPQP
jgi:hypothetical protein